MKKIQILLSGPLYRVLKNLTQKLDYPIAELLKQRAGLITDKQKNNKTNEDTWQMPKPEKLGIKISSSKKLREIAKKHC